MNKEASKIIGDVGSMESIAQKYFTTNFLRMPIISKAKFFNQMPFLYKEPHVDFTMLCLCIYLIVQRPDDGDAASGQSMHTSIYVSVKSLLAAVTSLIPLTLQTIQAMVLTVFYEVGHGLYPGAFISVAACARAARAIGLNKKQARRSSSATEMTVTEEGRRVWWAITNLDR